MNLPQNFLEKRRLQTLVENQTTYTMNNSELHIFETHQQAEQVLLQFHQPVLASMLEGKKVMHLDGFDPFPFLPGESVMMPADEMMCIDFPEARMNRPTRCLAMAISQDKIKDIVQFMDENLTKLDHDWGMFNGNFHFTNDVAVQHILQRLILLFTEDHQSKDLFVDFMLKELMVRIIQTENKVHYLNNASRLASNNRLAHVINYIKNNLDKTFSVKQLSDMAYMSESNFHRVFKNEFNMSPVEFVSQERIKLAIRLLKKPNTQIKEVYMACGFNSMSYFSRFFKSRLNLSPSAFQQMMLKNQSMDVHYGDLAS